MKHPFYNCYWNVKWEARLVSAVDRIQEVIQMVLLTNGAAVNQMVQKHPLKA